MKHIKIFESFTSAGIVDFLNGKKFKNRKSKTFLYHGTSTKPEDFELKDEWDGDSGNVYEVDLPEGYLFLTNDIREAIAYGRYIIPCELKYYDTLTVKVNSDAPSREFDDDFMGFGKYGMWTKFMNSGEAALEIRGNKKSTFVTSIDNVIARTDLAKQYYNEK